MTVLVFLKRGVQFGATVTTVKLKSRDLWRTGRLMSGNGRFLLFNIPFVYWWMCLMGLTLTGP